MNNYKIKVNGTHPLEYQDILDVASELGYDNEDWGNLYNVNYLFLNDDGSVGFSLNGEAVSDEHQELTLPQLRDLVVLKRKDINDANFLLRGNHYYKSSRGDWYFYGLNSWQHSTLTDLEGIEPILKEKPETNNEQGLISGADALRALADGKEVEYSVNNSDWELFAESKVFCPSAILSGINQNSQALSFRLKPRTITLSLEIPAPFEPKDGEESWCLDGNTLNGYKKIICDDFIDSGIGFWRTEEEIKQVVAALRGIKG